MQEIGSRPDVARCHAGLAKLYPLTGHRIESQEHFDIAATMYRVMG